MANVLIVTYEEEGHVRPFLSLSDSLEQLGIATRWYFPVRGTKATENVHRVGEPYWVDLPQRILDVPDLADQHLAGTKARGPEGVAAVRRAIRKVSDCTIAVEADGLLEPIATIAAQLEGVPLVRVSTNFAPLIGPDEAEHRRQWYYDRDTFAAALIADVLPNSAPPAQECAPVIVAAPKRLRRRSIPKSIVLTGWWQQPPQQVAQADREGVVVSFGSRGGVDTEFLRRVCESLWSAGVRRAVVAGPRDFLFPPYVVEPWIKQSDLVARAELLIGHGGASSVVEATCRHTPQIIVPFRGDQFAQSQLFEEAGVAMSVSLKKLSPSSFSRQVRTALSRREAMLSALEQLSGRQEAPGSLIAARMFLDVSRGSSVADAMRRHDVRRAA